MSAGRPSFFAELQRRHVYKVGAAYVVAGWLLAQVVTQVLPVFGVSMLGQRVLVLMVIAGFPIALVLAKKDFAQQIAVASGMEYRILKCTDADKRHYRVLM